MFVDFPSCEALVGVRDLLGRYKVPGKMLSLFRKQQAKTAD